MNNQATLLENSLLLIWNNRNSSERLELMKAIYSPDIEFFEGPDSGAFRGYADIDALITKLQSNWPLEFMFFLREPGRINHNSQWISWVLGASAESPVASGMDVARVENGKIRALYLYLDSKA